MTRYKNARMSEDQTLKRCCSCEEWKSLLDFYKNSSNNDGFQNSCVTCIRSKRAEKRSKDPEGHRRKERSAARKRNQQVYNWKRFGLELTVEDYNQMWNRQEGLCAICRQEEPFPNRRLAVDHCHATGKIRGLLCSQCNQALGNMKDNVKNLERAIEYLISHGGYK